LTHCRHLNRTRLPEDHEPATIYRLGPTERYTCFIDAAGDLFLIVYSVDSRESFDEARRLQEQVFLAKGGQATLSAHHGGRSRTPYVPHVVVGNKMDRDTERVVDSSELKALVDRYPNCCAAVEASAKRNHNVDEARYIVLITCNLRVVRVRQYGYWSL